MFGASEVDSDEDDAAPAPAAEPAKTQPTFSRVRTNHLGVPVGATSLRKIRYQHTLTVMWDAATMAKRERDDAGRIWRVLMDSRALVDGSLRGLRRLFYICRQAAPSPDQSLLNLRSFKMAMAMYNVRDDVLIMRLFDELCERDEDEDVELRIDARHFVRQFVAINREPIEDRLDLMFDLWDLDDSGTLKQAELAEHVVHDLPVYKRDRALETFSRIWAHLRAVATRDNEFMSSLHPGEVTKANVMEACRSILEVSHFFEEFTTRQPPKASSSGTWTEEGRRSHLKSRMSKLDAEVREEVRGTSQQQNARPSTATAVDKKGVARRGTPQGAIDPRLMDVGLLQMRRGHHMRAGEITQKDKEKMEKQKNASERNKNMMGGIESANSAALAILKPQRAQTFSSLGTCASEPGSSQRRPNTAASTKRYHSFIANSQMMGGHLPPTRMQLHSLKTSQSEGHLLPRAAALGGSAGKSRTVPGTQSVRFL